MKTSTVTIIGGLTMDLTYDVPSWPKPSKAVQAEKYVLSPGGKGLNFSTSCSRLGMSVKLVSSIGNDYFASEIKNVLKKEKILPKYLVPTKQVPTDLIGIIVCKKKPGFIGVTNSTGYLSTEHLDTLAKEVWDSNVMIVNAEVRYSVIKRSLEQARSNSVITIFNPAPPSKFDLSILKQVDYLILNKWEALVISGENDLKEAAKFLYKQGAKNVIITNGAEKGLYLNHSEVSFFNTFNVDAIDETGSGDAFCSAIAYQVTRTNDLKEMIHFASAAGALACQKIGSYGSQPTLKEVEKFLDQRKSEELF